MDNREREKLYQCPEYGGDICVHDFECFDCDIIYNPNLEKGGKN